MTDKLEQFSIQVNDKLEAQQKYINDLSDDIALLITKSMEIEKQRDLGIERIKKLEEWNCKIIDCYENNLCSLIKRIENLESKLSQQNPVPDLAQSSCLEKLNNSNIKSMEQLYSFEEALTAYKKGHRIKREPHMNWLENLHKNPDHKCRPFLSDILQNDWQIENYSKPKTKTLWIGVHKKSFSTTRAYISEDQLRVENFQGLEPIWEVVKIEVPE